CVYYMSCTSRYLLSPCFFFFLDTAPTVIYTLSLHDALPIYRSLRLPATVPPFRDAAGAYGRPIMDRIGSGEKGKGTRPRPAKREDRKSTRLNSSHVSISYAVFCLKKKKNKQKQ